MMVAVFNLWQLIIKGGPMMWPVLLMSVVALAVAIERIRFLSSAEKTLRVQQLNLMRSLQEEGVKKSLVLAESYQGMFSRIFQAAVLKFGNSSDVIKTAMEEIFIHEEHRLKERLGILVFIINASVLTGLLGTVIGLTAVFHAAQVRSNVLNPLSVGDFSAGVWQALLSTIAGMVVCIMSYAVYVFCSSMVDNLISDLRLSMARLTHVLVQLSELNDVSEEQ